MAESTKSLQFTEQPYVRINNPLSLNFPNDHQAQKEGNQLEAIEIQIPCKKRVRNARPRGDQKSLSWPYPLDYLQSALQLPLQR